jgi:hypothetical protein
MSERRSEEMNEIIQTDGNIKLGAAFEPLAWVLNGGKLYCRISAS